MTTLSDTVGDGMRLLICGLNPSPSSAESGVPFNRAGNRFWPAILASGLVTKDRDPLHALEVHRVGMTDLVKRTTSRASEISPEEFSDGVERLRVIVRRFKPRSICFVGLVGWRKAIDPKATPGWQDATIFGAKTYLMPSTSGLNASSSLDDLTRHLLIVAEAI